MIKDVRRLKGLKKILLTLGGCLLLIVILVVIRTAITQFVSGLENNKVLSYVLYFIFVVGNILIIRHNIKG